MTAQELKNYINKVLGNSIRCLLPSYWWRRLLTQIVGYVESVDGRVTTVDTSLSDVAVDVSKMINIIKKTSYVTITTSPEGPAKVYADGKSIDIPADETVQVFCGDIFCTVGPAGGNSDETRTILSIDTSMMITSWYKSMGNMFMWCQNISSLDVSHFDTSNVTIMNGMFQDCFSLTSLDLSNFDTSRVEYMHDMFDGCTRLASIDLSNFDTSRVIGMNGMFEDCQSLTSLDLSNFDTSRVDDMRGMFSYDYALIDLDLSNFDTSRVKNMGSMFLYCRDLTSLDLSNFDTSRVTSMESMFKGCTSLTSLSLGEGFFKTQSVTEVDFSDLEKWSQESFIQSVVTNSYDRTANGLPTLEVKLHSTVYAYLTDEHKSTLTDKGYVITSVNNED